MANDDYREQHDRARNHGLAARHETRVERANQQLVKLAYDEMLLRILAELDGRIQDRTKLVRYADEETEEFWLRMRAKGHPTRAEELVAYRRLHAQISEIGWETS